MNHVEQVEGEGEGPTADATLGSCPRMSSKSKPYQCQQCSVSFKRLDHLKRHVKLRTPERLRWEGKGAKSTD